MFPLYPDLVLDVAMPLCTRKQCEDPSQSDVLKLYAHCGYQVGGLREDEFRVELDVNEANDHE